MREKVLLVGEQVNGLAIQAVLERAGYQVMAANTSWDACQMLREVHPDLVVLDKSDVNPDGLELCRRLREMDAWMLIVVLAMQENEDDIVASLQAGADACIAQPVSEREFLARVGAILRRQRAWARRPGYRYYKRFAIKRK